MTTTTMIIIIMMKVVTTAARTTRLMMMMGRRRRRKRRTSRRGRGSKSEHSQKARLDLHSPQSEQVNHVTDTTPRVETLFRMATSLRTGLAPACVRLI